MTLFVSEPFENGIAVLDIVNDGVVFRVAGVHHIWSKVFDEPIDLAPVILETDDTNFSSNTTLNEGSDFYVANRGNNTIIRMHQDGTVVAIRHIRLDNGMALGNAHINGIATKYSPLEETAPPPKSGLRSQATFPGWAILTEQFSNCPRSSSTRLPPRATT